LNEPNATCYIYTYDDGTARIEQELNNDPLQITVHARLLGHGVLFRSTGRLEPVVLKFKVVLSPVRSASGRLKTGTCDRVRFLSDVKKKMATAYTAFQSKEFF
jgi:hypothetical protein